MEIANLAITGAFVSVLVQVLKNAAGTSPLGTRMVTIAAAIGAGIAYWYLVGTPAWEAIVQVLGYASAVYGFLLRPILEK